MPELAEPLRAAGVDRLNVSLDTLRPERYHEITRVGALSDVLRGLEAAERAGFQHTKLNCVLMGGVNDDEIANFVRLTKEHPLSVRFIELMPMGICAGWAFSNFFRFIFRSSSQIYNANPAAITPMIDQIMIAL